MAEGSRLGNVQVLSYFGGEGPDDDNLEPFVTEITGLQPIGF